jgi:extradiol dioxygenase family protein
MKSGQNSHVKMLALLRFLLLVLLANIYWGEATTTTPPAPGSPFHLAIPVHDIEEARAFYGGILGLSEGRRSDNKWQDYSLNGHQIVCHYVGSEYRCQDYYNPVDGDEVPVPHFGLALTAEEFHTMADRLRKSGIRFIVEPHLRFQGQPGEQHTMFFKDPSGNNLEFKAMTHPGNLFARYNVVDNAK